MVGEWSSSWLSWSALRRGGGNCLNAPSLKVQLNQTEQFW